MRHNQERGCIGGNHGTFLFESLFHYGMMLDAEAEEGNVEPNVYVSRKNVFASWSID